MDFFKGLQVFIEGLGRGNGGTLLLLPTGALVGVAIGGEGGLDEVGFLAFEVFSSAVGDLGGGFGREEFGRFLDGVGCGIGVAGGAAEGVGGGDGFGGGGADLRQGRLAELGNALADDAGFFGGQLIGSRAGGDLNLIPEVVGELGGGVEGGFEAGELTFGVIGGLVFFGKRGVFFHFGRGLLEFAGLGFEIGGGGGEALLGVCPGAEFGVDGLFLDGEADGRALGGLTFEVGDGELDEEGVAAFELEGSEGEEVVQFVFTGGGGHGDRDVGGSAGVDGGAQGGGLESDVVAGEADDAEAFIGEELQKVGGFGEGDGGWGVGDGGDAPWVGFVVGELGFGGGEAGLPGVQRGGDFEGGGEFEGGLGGELGCSGRRWVGGVESKGGGSDGLVGFESERERGAFEGFDVAIRLGDGDGREASVSRWGEGFYEGVDGGAWAGGEGVPGCEAVGGGDAVAEVGLGDGEFLFEAGALEEGHFEFAGGGARFAEFDEDGGVFEVAGDAGGDFDFGDEGGEGVGGSGSEDFDFDGGGAFDGGEGEGSAGEEAGEVEARGDGEGGEDEGKEGEAAEPGGEGGEGEGLRPADGLDFGSDFVLEAGAEFGGVGDGCRGIAGLGEFDSSEEALAEGGGGIFDEAGGFGVGFSGAKLAPGELPGGEGGGGVDSESDPRAGGVGQEAGAVEKSDKGEGGSGDDEEGEEGAPVEERRASGAEGSEGLEGGGTQSEIHGVRIERNRKRAVTSRRRKFGISECRFWIGNCGG